MCHETADVHLGDGAFRDIALRNLHILLYALFMRHAHFFHEGDELIDEVVNMCLGITNFKYGDLILLSFTACTPLKGNDVWIVHVSSDAFEGLQRCPEFQLSQELMSLYRR